MSRVARLGFFIFGALLLLAIAVFIIGDKQFLFSTTYRLNAPFDNVSGLHNGAEVRVGGVRKGTVDQIQMPRQPGEKVTVVMDLESSTREVIKKDSVTGVKGDKHENLVLTQARAMVVRQYLADNFKLDDSRLRTKGWGEDEQAEVGKASRVEITVYPEGSGRGPGKNKQ